MSDDAELVHEWLDSFFEFFEWVYELELKEGARARVELELKRGWSNSDDSEIAFFARVLRAQDQVKASTGKDEAAMRAKARENLKGEFSDTALTDKCRVLASLHTLLESANPGCTGVAPAKRLGQADLTSPGGGGESGRSRVSSESRRPEHYDSRPKTNERPVARVDKREMTRMPSTEIDTAPRHPGKVPIPPPPNLWDRNLDAERTADAMAQYWANVHRIHIMNGDNFEAQRAMQEHQNYMNMMITINRKTQEILGSIWR